MGYRVIRGFRDIENDNYTYKKGDVFPVSGKESEERIEYLMSPENKLGEPVIEKLNQDPDTLDATNEENALQEEEPAAESTQKEKEQSEEVEYPKHTGGPWYELSNGEKIQGKDEAVQAEKELK